MGEGRFGQVYLAHDAGADRPVVVRTFQRFDASAHQSLLDALRALCERPLDHSSIARPLASGVEAGLPYLVQSYFPGTPLDEFMSLHGPQSLTEVVLRVTQVAAALDFAAAAGVFHGLLGRRDVILGSESTGVTGLGLVQAMSTAGIHIEGAAATHADDIHVLATLAFELLTGQRYSGTLAGALASIHGADARRLDAAFASPLSADAETPPTTALDFARALQQAVVVTPHHPVLVTSGPAESDFAEFPLREEAPALALAFDDMAPATDVELGQSVPPPPARADMEESAQSTRLRGDDFDPPEMFAHATAAPTRRWPLVAAALAIGVLTGFAGGFLLGQQADLSVIVGALTEPPIEERRPEPTNGRADADAPVAGGDTDQRSGTAGDSGSGPRDSGVAGNSGAPTAPPAGESPEIGVPEPPVARDAPPASSPASQPVTPGRIPNAEPGSAITPSGPGSLQVLSRPAGAQVFVDGTAVGRTPLSVPDVRAGAHAIRIELPGHRRWATSVTVRPGEQTRVAASLEE